MKMVTSQLGHQTLRPIYNEVVIHPLIQYRSLLSSEEIKKLRETLENDGGIVENAFIMNDGHGRHSRMSLWSHPGKDITGMVARSEKVAGTMEEVETYTL